MADSARAARGQLLGLSGYYWLVIAAGWAGGGFDVCDALLFNFVSPKMGQPKMGQPKWASPNGPAQMGQPNRIPGTAAPGARLERSARSCRVGLRSSLRQRRWPHSCS
jgi:hypothetical protein